MPLESNDSDARSNMEPTSFEVVPLTLHIGAEIHGVNLTKPLPDQQIARRILTPTGRPHAGPSYLWGSRRPSGNLYGVENAHDRSV